MNGTIYNYKANLIKELYAQKDIIDYKETFSPVVI